MQVSTFLTRGLYAHLAQRGLAEAFLQRAGVSRALLESEHARCDLPAMLRVGEAAYALSADPALALHAGEAASLQTLGVVGALFAQASSLRELFLDLQRFLPLLCTRGSLQLREHERRAHLLLTLPELEEPVQRFVTEYVFAFIYKVGRELLGGTPLLHELSVRHGRPAYTAAYERTFGCAPRFRALHNELVLPCEYLERPLLFANARLHKLLGAEAQSLLESEIQGAPVHQRAYHLLRSDPALCGRDSNAIAKQMRISPRRLRRRLAAEGKNLSSLVEQARLEQASSLLSETDLAIKCIAERLGYSEPSAFHRAFKRWTGETPIQYRRTNAARNPQAAPELAS